MVTNKLLDMWFHIAIAITSVWKVQFQQFKHFSVACNELFHMVHLTQKMFSYSNLDVYPCKLSIFGQKLFFVLSIPC